MNMQQKNINVSGYVIINLHFLKGILLEILI